MKKVIALIFFISILCQFLACGTEQDKKNQDKEKENIFGLYYYSVTGYNSGCKNVKHSLRLNDDSTFIFKIYCASDTASSYPITLKKGIFTKENDSVLNFQCNDRTSFDMRILNEQHIKMILQNRTDQFNYPFEKDTSINEDF